MPDVLLGSASLPSTCSGDMYSKVPAICPFCEMGLTGLVRVTTLVPAAALIAAAAGLASPKSSSFAPDFVSIMLPGFRSR